MKGRGSYILLGVLAAVFAGVILVQKPPLDWTPNYERDASTPLGAEIFYTLLPSWAGTPVEPLLDPPFLVLEDTTRTDALYFFLTQRFEPDPIEAERLFQFAERGNTVFVGAEHIGGLLADTLGMSETMADSLLASRSLYTYPQRLGIDADSSLTLVNPAVHRDSGYVFPHDVGVWMLAGLDPERSTVLGLSADSLITLAHIKVGEGAFVVSTTPMVFTNVMLARDGDAADYIGAVLGGLQAETILWDTYYKPTGGLARTPLRVLLASRSLKWGYGLLVLGGLLFLLFRGRRWQRPIPVVKSPPNAQLEFVRTVGRLYAQHDDRKALVERKLRFFYDRLRGRLGLDEVDLSETTEQHVARRSGLPEGPVRVLFTRFRRLSRTAQPSPDDLLALDRDLDWFYAAIGERAPASDR